MYLTAPQISALAQLLLQKGNWKGGQLVPSWWIEEMGKPRVEIPGDEKKALRTKINSLSLVQPEGAFRTARQEAARLFNRKILFTENPRKIESAVLTKEGYRIKIEAVIDGEQKVLYAGYKAWKCNDLYPSDFTKRYHSVAYAMDAEALYLSVGLINTSYKEEYCLWVNSEDKVIATWRPNVTYLPEEPDMVWKFTGTFE